MSVPAPVPKTPIMTLRFNGYAPHPHPPCTDPTPDEEYDTYEKNRNEALINKEEERQRSLAEQEQTQGGSTLFKLGKGISGIAAKLEKGTSNVQAAAEAKIRQVHKDKNAERFRTNFPQLVATDTLITDYECKVMHQGQRVHGHAIVTNRHLCFVSDTLIEIIPYPEIASVQRSVALETLDNGPPFIMVIPAPNVLPDTLQIFTTKMQLFQFIGFTSTLLTVGSAVSTAIKGRCIDRFYNFLDHAWRAAVVVPLPGLGYA